MLIRHDIVFVLRVRRLVLQWHVDFFVGELRRPVELLEEVGGAGLVHVHVGVGGVFGLWKGALVRGSGDEMEGGRGDTIVVERLVEVVPVA